MNLVIIEGNIGSLKTSTLRALEQRTSLPNIVPLYEDVAAFSKFDSHNPLAEAYNEPQKNVICAQIHIIRCINRQLAALTPDKSRLHISERSIFSPLVFTGAYLDAGTISPFTHDFIVQEIYDSARTTYTKTVVKYKALFFLECRPDICLERINRRARPSEIGKITIEYLQNLQRRYDEHLVWWRESIGNERIIVINTENLSANQVADIIALECKRLGCV